MSVECGVWSCELDTQLHQNNINTNKSNTLAIKTTPSKNCTNSPSIFNTNTTIRLKSSDIGTNQYIAINIAILCCVMWLSGQWHGTYRGIWAHMIVQSASYAWLFGHSFWNRSPSNCCFFFSKEFWRVKWIHKNEWS